MTKKITIEEQLIKQYEGKFIVATSALGCCVSVIGAASYYACTIVNIFSNDEDEDYHDSIFVLFGLGTLCTLLAMMFGYVCYLAAIDGAENHIDELSFHGLTGANDLEIEL